MKALALSFLLLAALATSGPVRAQRRETRSPPVELALVHWPGDAGAPLPYRYVLALRASDAVEVIADARLLRLEVTVPGRRRPHRCEMPGRPRRADESRARTLGRGERWAEWIDLREVCWGRALDALTTEGATIEASYGVGRGRHAWVARTADAGSSATALAPVEVIAPGLPAASTLADAADARITLASADARSASPTFRVAVYGAGTTTRRAWLRPDRFRFRVVDPAGATWSCSLPRTGGAPIPDLFSRIGARRAVRFSLDGGTYCDGVFEHGGVYEVTPIVELDERGEAWELDAVVGTFTGEPAAIRVRGDRGDRSVPADVLARLLR